MLLLPVALGDVCQEKRAARFDRPHNQVSSAKNHPSKSKQRVPILKQAHRAGVVRAETGRTVSSQRPHSRHRPRIIPQEPEAEIRARNTHVAVHCGVLLLGLDQQQDIVGVGCFSTPPRRPHSRKPSLVNRLRGTDVDTETPLPCAPATSP